MMYLLTMGWFLAHTSLAMTPEHSATNGEYSSLRSARAGHSKSTQSMAKPSMAWGLETMQIIIYTDQPR